MIETDQRFTTDPKDIDVKMSTGIRLSWKDLDYTVKVTLSKKQAEAQSLENRTYNKQILKPQSGYVNSGETMFIMGSSGAGKTTLLNAL